MFSGAITSSIDVAQLTLYAFWIFFIALVWYLRGEDKREGYPLLSDRSDHVTVQGLPPMPPPKTFHLRDGSTFQAPAVRNDERAVAAVPVGPWLGAPLQPSGDPMRDGVGPAAWASRQDHPEMTAEGGPMIVPMRADPSFFVEPNDPDPRGFEVVAADGRIAGKVSDLWIDRSEPQIRYLEVTLPEGRDVLLPMNYVRIDGGRHLVKVRAILASQFAGVPAHASPDRITLLEEDKILAYFGSGHLYATPLRSEPLI